MQKTLFPPTLSRQSSLPMDDTRINISIQRDRLNSQASISGVRPRSSSSVDSKFLVLDVDTVVVVPPTPPTRGFVVVTSHKTRTAVGKFQRMANWIGVNCVLLPLT